METLGISVLFITCNKGQFVRQALQNILNAKKGLPISILF